jgi:hypothetical protein
MQARLTLPVLLVTLAVTPPFLLQSVAPGGALSAQELRRGYKAPVWQVRPLFMHLLSLDVQIPWQPESGLGLCRHFVPTSEV